MRGAVLVLQGCTDANAAAAAQHKMCCCLPLFTCAALQQHRLTGLVWRTKLQTSDILQALPTLLENVHTNHVFSGFQD